MQIYTQFPNYARKNMNFLSQQVNRSTSQRVFGVLKGLFRVCFGSAWVCFRVCEKKSHLFNPLNPIYT